MAQRELSSPALVPLILRYGFALLSIANRTRFNPFSSIKLRR